MTRLACCEPGIYGGLTLRHGSSCRLHQGMPLTDAEKAQLRSRAAHPAQGSNVPLRAVGGPEWAPSACDTAAGCEDPTCHRCVVGDYFMGDEDW